MNFAKHLLLSVVTILSLSSAYAGQSFPNNPDAKLTPGSVCNHPDSYRYRERVPYCERNVETSLKYHIIDVYNQVLGYRIDRSDRHQFKIDHLIPLCMGGSNQQDNLWPQHQSVYNVTDPLEGMLCEKMKDGKLLQKHAIEYIMTAKKDLSKARQIFDTVRRL